ncbi:MAG: hypothetical protein JJU24_07945 [Natronohydrobacter sp.]|nr:hypothetical protein [Natronohydrobacter sp.]
MPRVFTYEENGLSYTVTVYESDGQIFADVTVNSGFMDVNAVYIADDDFSGASASLGGPLNMNGGGSQFEGETVQWDDAIALSRPGLGREGTDKPTFLQAGETLTVQLNVDSIEDVDFVGIRATSTSTPEGSIKGVSGNPEDEDNGDDDDDDNGDDDDGDATYSKVFFVYDPDADILGGFIFTNDDLPEDAEGTFADYVALMDSTSPNDIPLFNAVIFYQGDDLEEVFRLEGPFEDADALIAAYNEAIQSFDVDGLMIAFVGDEDAALEDAPEEDEVEVI